ncbi:helix-turn-helix domain-containing protein [Streptomyces sp. NBC_01304]|uniref:helix-turn-helix domain-containing protein n=1 Tax=Streptomyces sp. NBC_01304 TaxID=2903818 RepID=UPI002E116B2B|nr:helix-turn-helix transcriptional regulator [Streptomyces sp. NBC_01304]
MNPAKKRVTSWHAIGAMIANFRRYAGMNQGELAAQLCVSEDKMASIEQGRRPLQLSLATKIDELLDTKRALETFVSRMPEKEKFPLPVQDLVEYEQEAKTIQSYQTQVVDGLLQTEDYMRAVFKNRYPPVDRDEADEWVAGRLERQKIWERQWPPWAHFIVEEAALKKQWGGQDAWRGTLRRMREIGELRSVGLQVIPHAGINGPFILLETTENERLAYLEVQRLSAQIEDPDEVSFYQLKYGMLQSQALPPDDSARLLDDLLGET